MWEQQQQQLQVLQQHSSSAENAANKILCTLSCTYCLLYTRTVFVVVDAHNEVPGININSTYYTHDNCCESTHKISMFCHTCFASHNTWLAGPAVGLRTECTYLHNKREGCTYVILLSIVGYRRVVWSLVLCMAIDTNSGTGRQQPIRIVYYHVERARQDDVWRDGFRERHRFTSRIQALSTSDRW